MPSTPARSLVADIGGTNTRVALAEGGVLIPGSSRRYRNDAFGGLEPVLRLYLSETGAGRPVAACLAMAGPVHDGKGALTNLDWTLDTRILATATGAETVALLNDLQAQGHALGHLPQEALQVIIPGPPPPLDAPQLVVGLGTGFNAAPVFNTGARRFVPPSESGHASLPVRTVQDLALAQFITERHGFASIEDALSGRGLGTIHAFLAAHDNVPTMLRSHQIIELAGRPDAGSEGARCRDALALFIRLTAEVCGDLALTMLPFGGVFLVGGMARAIAPLCSEMGFAEAFRDKGRFGPFMEQFAVTLVTDDDAALIGSARHLQALLSRSGVD